VRGCCKHGIEFSVSINRVTVVCILLGISPASDCDFPTFRNLLSVPSSKAGCRVTVVHTYFYILKK
jgi:hypothetical protein